MTVQYLTTEQVVRIGQRMLGKAFLVRDLGLLEAATARPATVLFGEDAYPGLLEKAAALLHSIAKNHPLVDGNKRLGYVATATFLELNGVSVREGVQADEIAYQLVMDVATGALSEVDAIAKRLVELVENPGGGD